MVVKRIWKIISRVLLTLGIVIYVVIALVNYSVVQSYAGAVAGNYFSREWGGELRIGSLHAMPFDHLILDHVLWVSPSGDTLFDGESIRVSFDHFPFNGTGLDLNRVQLKNAYYHFATEGGNKINLKFLIDYFKSKPKKEKKDKPHTPFTVKAKTLILDNVHYKMDLPDHRKNVYPYGVQIPHMEYFNIHATIKNVKVVNDDITCRIVKFSTRERSGFELKRLAGDIHVSRYEIVARNMSIETGASTIEVDAELKYNTWKGIKGYVSTVQHDATLKEGTRVAMSDVAYWAPTLWGIEATAEAEGTATGTIDSMTTDMMVRWGDSSSALVAGSIMGLPKIDTTVFDINIEHLRTNAKDLSPLTKAIGFVASQTKIIEDLGTLNLSATLNGGLKESAAVNLLADCRLGQLRTDATLHHTPSDYRFTVDCNSDGIRLEMLNSEWLTHSGFDLSMVGRWRGDLKRMKEWNRRLDMAIDGHLTNSMVNGRQLNSATLQGQLKNGALSAMVESTDSIVDMTVALQAGLADSVKNYEADVRINNLDIGLLPKPLATTVTAKLHGNTLDEMSGTAKARMTKYGDMLLKNLDLSIETDARGKEIELTSDLADVDIRGQFQYGDLPLMVRYFGQKYLPEMFNRGERIDSATAATLADKTLAFQVRWLDDGSILHGLVDNITVARGTRIDGSYNFSEQMKLVARSDSLRIGAINLKSIGLNGRAIGNLYLLQMESQMFDIGKMELLDRMLVTLNSTPQLTTAELSWGSEDSPSRGDLMLSLQGNEIQVTKPRFFVGETPWELSTEGLTIENNDRLMIAGERISFESQQQKINARMSLKGETNDCVELFFDKFSLDLLSDVLLQDSPLDIHGDINGRFSLYGINETPYFNANLAIDSCMVNSLPMGEMRLTSNWNAELNILNMLMISEKLDASGWVELGRQNPNLTFDVNFRSLDLALAKPLLSSFSTHIDGKLDGNVSLSGSAAHPMLLGEALVNDGELRIDITNVTYHFSDSISLNNNIITLKDFEIHDSQGNVALANGQVELTDEKKIQLDLGLNTDNLMVLNQKSGEQFYGTLFASAEGMVRGPVDQLDIYVRARTNPGCELTVPISYQQRVKTQNYITFVGAPEASDEGPQATSKKERPMDFNLELDLSITPDVKLNLPMDFKEVGVSVGATGEGDIHLNLGGNGVPQVIGNYVISSGLMKVGLFSVYEKRFAIQNGSSLNFQGTVPDARFDMQAVYSQRVNLSTLTGNLSSIDNTQKYLQVENVISIAGTLQDPTIGFDIRLPNADQSVEEEVFAYIDRNSERDMLNQTLSLLVNGSFYNVNSDNTQNAGSPLDFVTSFVGNSLTDMVQFIDVNIDYKSATEQTNQQLDVNISKDWGRWYLESTLGYGGESRDLEANNMGGAIIDALIGYRLSPMFHLFAYNRTNTNDYTRIDLPYKQGAGLKLTKDFDRWSDLFKFKKKRKEKQ